MYRLEPATKRSYQLGVRTEPGPTVTRCFGAPRVRNRRTQIGRVNGESCRDSAREQNGSIEQGSVVNGLAVRARLRFGVAR